MFKQELYKTSWDDVINNKNQNHAYNYFLQYTFYYFPKQNIRIYKKDLQSPWITRGVKKSSKPNQKLFVKSLKKTEIAKMNLNIEIIRNFLSQLKNVQNRVTFRALYLSIKII